MMKTAAKREAGSTSIDKISNLPWEILQRILYLLCQEEAVRTSVLSKSWRYILCTRPNLYFSYDTFKGNIQEFLSVVSNSLQRYCDQSLRVEEFGLCNRYCDQRLTEINVSHHHNLKNFTFRKQELCSIEIHPPSIQTMDVDYCCSLWFHKGADFRNLKVLSFSLTISPLHHLSSCKFQSLQSLQFLYCEGLKGIQLFIDAPNINRFQYTGIFVPTISFATPSNQWESRIDLTYQQHRNGASPSSLWFLKLKELLNSVRRSKISLIPRNHYKMKFRKNFAVRDSGFGKAIVVERLTIRCPFFNFPCLLNGALSICRPRNIGKYVLRSAINEIDCLWKSLMQRESGDQLNQLRELEEASMEVYNDNREEWRPITLSELPMYDQETEYDLIQFVLKWRENYITFS